MLCTSPVKTDNRKQNPPMVETELPQFVLSVQFVAVQLINVFIYFLVISISLNLCKAIKYLKEIMRNFSLLN